MKICLGTFSVHTVLPSTMSKPFFFTLGISLVGGKYFHKYYPYTALYIEILKNYGTHWGPGTEY